MPFGKFGSALKRNQKEKYDSVVSEEPRDDTKRKHSFSLKSAFSRPPKAEIERKAAESEDSEEDDIDDRNLSLVVFSDDWKPKTEKPEKSAWAKYCATVNRGEHIGTPKRGLARLPSNIASRALGHFDFNEKKNESFPLPMDWFRSGLDLFRKQDGEPRSDIDCRLPMILISGLPGVGKTAVERALAHLLEETHAIHARRNRRPSPLEAAWEFFVDPRPRAELDPSHSRADPSGCRRPETSSPVESFANGKAIVVNVDHLSCTEALREEYANDSGNSRYVAGPSMVDAAAEAWWYCSSMASLQSNNQADPETIRRLDRGRRLAVEKYVMPKAYKQSCIILTECLFADDRNGKSEVAAAAYKTAAGVFERRLIPIYLTCDAKEHKRRLECRQRNAQKSSQDTQNPAISYIIQEKDATMLKSESLEKSAAHIDKLAKAGNGRLYFFSQPAEYKDGKFYIAMKARVGDDFEPIDMPDEHQGCVIDTTGLTASEAAMIAQWFCQDVMRGMPLQTWAGWNMGPMSGGDGGKQRRNSTNTEGLFIK
ncbi:hypothetical protein SCUCBS95973_004324 [Sporothrix curviconia]|uniref:P-loop containing nucleoside triphosphate hydrolase protein n=1 Tax=Sporothrix curviconia TaxID=1260050 RepID=A0ABP0BN50_9PEZI